MDSFYIWYNWPLLLEGVSRLTFFEIWKFEFLANFWNFSALTLKNKSTVHDGFFPYLAQMITSMRGCVTYNDLWPCPISSRSFGLCLENYVHSVLLWMDSFYIWHKLSLSLEGVSRVTFFQNLKIFGNFFKFFGLDLKKNLQLSMDSLHI